MTTTANDQASIDKAKGIEENLAKIGYEIFEIIDHPRYGKCKIIGFLKDKIEEEYSVISLQSLELDKVVSPNNKCLDITAHSKSMVSIHPSHQHNEIADTICLYKKDMPVRFNKDQIKDKRIENDLAELGYKIGEIIHYPSEGNITIIGVTTGENKIIIFEGGKQNCLKSTYKHIIHSTFLSDNISIGCVYSKEVISKENAVKAKRIEEDLAKLGYKVGEIIDVKSWGKIKIIGITRGDIIIFETSYPSNGPVVGTITEGIHPSFINSANKTNVLFHEHILNIRNQSKEETNKEALKKAPTEELKKELDRRDIIRNKISDELNKLGFKVGQVFYYNNRKVEIAGYDGHKDIIGLVSNGGAKAPPSIEDLIDPKYSDDKNKQYVHFSPNHVRALMKGSIIQQLNLAGFNAGEIVYYGSCKCRVVGMNDRTIYLQNITEEVANLTPFDNQVAAFVLEEYHYNSGIFGLEIDKSLLVKEITVKEAELKTKMIASQNKEITDKLFSYGYKVGDKVEVLIDTKNILMDGKGAEKLPHSLKKGTVVGFKEGNVVLSFDHKGNGAWAFGSVDAKIHSDFQNKAAYFYVDPNYLGRNAVNKLIEKKLADSNLELNQTVYYNEQPIKTTANAEHISLEGVFNSANPSIETQIIGYDLDKNVPILAGKVKKAYPSKTDGNILLHTHIDNNYNLVFGSKESVSTVKPNTTPIIDKYLSKFGLKVGDEVEFNISEDEYINYDKDFNIFQKTIKAKVVGYSPIINKPLFYTSENNTTAWKKETREIRYQPIIADSFLQDKDTELFWAEQKSFQKIMTPTTTKNKKIELLDVTSLKEGDRIVIYFSDVARWNTEGVGKAYHGTYLGKYSPSRTPYNVIQFDESITGANSFLDTFKKENPNNKFLQGRKQGKEQTTYFSDHFLFAKETFRDNLVIGDFVEFKYNNGITYTGIIVGYNKVSKNPLVAILSSTNPQFSLMGSDVVDQKFSALNDKNITELQPSMFFKKVTDTFRIETALFISEKYRTILKEIFNKDLNTIQETNKALLSEIEETLKRVQEITREITAADHSILSDYISGKTTDISPTKDIVEKIQKLIKESLPIEKELNKAVEEELNKAVKDNIISSLSEEDKKWILNELQIINASAYTKEIFKNFINHHPGNQKYLKDVLGNYNLDELVSKNYNQDQSIQKNIQVLDSHGQRYIDRALITPADDSATNTNFYEYIRQRPLAQKYLTKKIGAYDLGKLSSFSHKSIQELIKILPAPEEKVDWKKLAEILKTQNIETHAAKKEVPKSAYSPTEVSDPQQSAKALEEHERLHKEYRDKGFGGTDLLILDEPPSLGFWTNAYYKASNTDIDIESKSKDTMIVSEAGIEIKDGVAIRIPEVPSAFKTHCSKAGYRIAGTQITNLTKSTLVSFLQSKNVSNKHLIAFSDFLDTDFGKSFIAMALGLSLAALPMAQENETAQKVAEELRIHSITTLGNSVFDVFIAELLQVISSQETETKQEEPINEYQTEEETNQELNVAYGS